MLSIRTKIACSGHRVILSPLQLHACSLLNKIGVFTATWEASKVSLITFMYMHYVHKISLRSWLSIQVFPTSHKGDNSWSLWRSPPGGSWYTGSTALAPPSHTGGHMASHYFGGGRSICSLDCQGSTLLGFEREGNIMVQYM